MNTRPFSELVIEGPFLLVKGFLVGFLSCAKPEGKYFFHRKSGIRRETLKDFLKDFFELDNYVHLCLETELVDQFLGAAKFYQEKTGMKVQSVRSIRSASFSIAYEFYNEKLAGKAKKMLQDLPSGVKITDYAPLEIKDERGEGIEAYAPLHKFTSRGKGEVVGDFGGVLELYLTIKRSDISESIICSDVRLDLEENEAG